MISTQDRYRGCLMGLAAGDAVGTAVEFEPPGTFPPVTGMAGGGPFGLAACPRKNVLSDNRHNRVLLLAFHNNPRML